MSEVYNIVIANFSKNLTSCFVESVLVTIVMRLNPFCFEYSPESLCDIQVRAIRGQEEKEQPSFHPNFRFLSNRSLAVNGCVVQNHHCGFGDTQRELIKEVCQKLSGNGVLGIKTVISTIRGDHSEQIKSMFISGRHKDLLFCKMPSIWHISACADMALISESEVYMSFLPKTYKFLQLFLLDVNQLRRGYSPWAFSYTLISCANTFKKRLKVMSLTFLPEDFSHSALAVLILSRCALMAFSTASRSWAFIKGLVPRPPFSRSPSNPSFLYRLNQSYTASGPYPTKDEMSLTGILFALISMALQRIRKRWHEPNRYAFSRATRSWSESMSFGVFSIVFIISRCDKHWRLQNPCHKLYF